MSFSTDAARAAAADAIGFVKRTASVRSLEKMDAPSAEVKAEAPAKQPRTYAPRSAPRVVEPRKRRIWVVKVVRLVEDTTDSTQLEEYDTKSASATARVATLNAVVAEKQV